MQEYVCKNGKKEQQFDGQKWINSEISLSQSRSAFAVTTIPGHLVQGC